MNRFLTCAAVFVILVTAGCGKETKGTDAAATPGQKDVLDDVKLLLGEAKNANKRPPANKAEFMSYDATNPVATSGLGRGMIVYMFGQGLSGGQAVVAHDAQCEKAGGWVLLQDGTIQNMTADEFKAAPKAGKK